MRETFQDVEINKRKFRINKFDALTGSYIVFTVMTQVMPMGIGGQIEGLPNNASKAPAMPKEVFIELQKDCLKACSEIIMTGNTVAPVPVMLPDGRWGVPDIENDAGLAMFLTIQVLGYNLQSFFDENTLEGFKNGLTQLNSSSV